MSAYLALKLLHQVTVVVTISLFILRVAIRNRHPEQDLPKVLKILPHANDTVLLVAGVGMLVVLNINPLTTPWLAVKLVLLVAYILMGALCLRSAPRSPRHWAAFFLALLTFISIVVIALNKQVPLG